MQEGSQKDQCRKDQPSAGHRPEAQQGLAFSAEVEAQLEAARQWCVARGERLTPTRAQVLGLILSDPRPSGAYELLSRLRESHPRAAPPTVYRALEFLLGLGLIHRIERLSAFTACLHVLECHDSSCCPAGSEAGRAVSEEAGTTVPKWAGHRAYFLICRLCGHVRELEEALVSRLLLQTASGLGFRAESATVEIVGVCAECAGK
ncbi:transcriptional repressor [Oecophyllibacter saccharovorans]|uniref:Fur family transcriptional regulator n=1 Tax=Oecophyllibacter saccharovorans TaxID=2558360 RepID=UPI0011438FAE|nr:Fur family transcriptional regulator [Oecophyllibacter saccharovorans]QDH15361.1 transcriptional repressor [Oecophyllibacter saccharovorans]